MRSDPSPINLQNRSFEPRLVALLWGMFFLICFGLGYPSLNRYDPRLGGSPDAIQYYKIVEESPHSAEPHYRHRVLVPYLAKPIYWLSKNRVGSWNPVFFALLVVNALLTATSACLLMVLGYKLLGDYHLGLVAGFLYLLNFNVPNTFLSAGLVDSGEACLMLVAAWAMSTMRWSLLPIIGIVGALAKETFVPCSIVFCGTWLAMVIRQEGFRWSDCAWVFAMAIAGLATVTILESALSRHVVWPWEFALSEKSEMNFFGGLHEPFSDHSFLYIFAWLVPLGLWHLSRLPKPWVLASLAAALTAFVLGVWHESGVGQGSGIPRAIFNVAGPILTLSTASLLARSRPSFK